MRNKATCRYCGTTFETRQGFANHERKCAAESAGGGIAAAPSAQPDMSIEQLMAQIKSHEDQALRLNDELQKRLAVLGLQQIVGNPVPHAPTEWNEQHGEPISA